MSCPFAPPPSRRSISAFAISAFSSVLPFSCPSIDSSNGHSGNRQVYPKEFNFTPVSLDRSVFCFKLLPLRRAREWSQARKLSELQLRLRRKSRGLLQALNSVAIETKYETTPDRDSLTVQRFTGFEKSFESDEKSAAPRFEGSIH